MRIGLLSVGRLGAAHAATLRGLKDVRELRVYDMDATRGSTVAKAVGATAVRTADDALDGAEAAVIVTPTDVHGPIIRRCLDAGIPTLREKPAARSSAPAPRPTRSRRCGSARPRADRGARGAP